MEKRRLLPVLLAIFYMLNSVSWCREMKLTPEEASKITRRDIAANGFNEGAKGFLSGSVQVPDRVRTASLRPRTRSIEDIKRELERVWRELHVSSPQHEAHSILPKDTKKSISKDQTGTTAQEGELQLRSSRMEKLEGIVDNLIKELESEGQQRREISKTKKSIETKHLQKDIDALLQVSDELKRDASNFKRQKLSGIGRSVENNNAGRPHERQNFRRESHRQDVKELLAHLVALHQKRSQQEDDGPPKITGFGREMSASEAFQALVKSYLKEKMKREARNAFQTSARGNKFARELISDELRELLKDKKTSKRSTDKLIELLSTRLARDMLSPPGLWMKDKAGSRSRVPQSRREMLKTGKNQSPPMLPSSNAKRNGEMLDKSARIALLKRAIALLKLQRSIPIFKKSRESDRRSELKEAKALEGQSNDVKLADLKRRVAAMRLLSLYGKSKNTREDNLERELALVARDRFASDSDRFSTNRVGGKNRPENSVTATSTGHGHDLNSLLDLHGDGVSHETVKTLKGFHKPDQREVRNPPLSQISPETSSSLTGFDTSEN